MLLPDLGQLGSHAVVDCLNGIVSRSRRLNRLLPLSALALVVGVLSACGSSECDAPPARGVDWSGCDKRGAKLAGANLEGATLRDANLTGANLSGANCNNDTWWPDGTNGHGSECPPTD